MNIAASAYSKEIQDALEPYIYEVVGEQARFPEFDHSNWPQASLRGSVSAEHGIGAMKIHALGYSKDEVSIALMKKIKRVFDPHGIMNPGKVLEM